MTGISTVSSRRFPASLSSKPITAFLISDLRFLISERLQSKIGNQKSKILVVARDRLNGGDHFFVGHLIGGTGEAGVAAVHEDAAIVLGIAPQRGDQLPSFRFVEWTEIHRRSPF